MTTLNWRDVGERVGWTFVQAFVAVLVAAGASWVHLAVWQSAALAAGAAALAAVKTVLAQGLTGSSAVPPSTTGG